MYGGLVTVGSHFSIGQLRPTPQSFFRTNILRPTNSQLKVLHISQHLYTIPSKDFPQTSRDASKSCKIKSHRHKPPRLPAPAHAISGSLLQKRDGHANSRAPIFHAGSAEQSSPRPPTSHPPPLKHRPSTKRNVLLIRMGCADNPRSQGLPPLAPSSS